MTFKIDDDVPMPERRGPKNRRYPFPEMEIGQSVFIPNKSASDITMCWRRLKGKLFTARKWTQAGVPGVRVWRIE